MLFRSLRARYYAPQNGGFITQDSFSGVLDDALTQNRYTYAGNNPLNNIDPSGHRYIKGIEIGDNLKSSSAKKQPTTSGRPLSPGLTGAVVKKTTTNKKAPAISGSIAANAALSAARAGVPVGASSAVVKCDTAGAVHLRSECFRANRDGSQPFLKHCRGCQKLYPSHV